MPQYNIDTSTFVDRNNNLFDSTIVVDEFGVPITPMQQTGGTLGKGDLTTDAWGIQKVSFPKSLYHGMWTFDIPQSMWFTYENGVQVYTSTNIISEGGSAKLLTSPTKTSLVLESRECPRYQPNRGHLFSCAGWAPLKTTDMIERWWGLRTIENGIFFRLKSDGLLYAVRKSNNVEVQEEVIDTSNIVNTDGSAFDVEKNNTYDIQFQWRSAGNYIFFINQQFVHIFTLLGTQTTTTMQNPALPVSIGCTMNTGDAPLYMGCADITSENGQDDSEQYSSSFAQSVSINGTDQPVMILFKPLTINGRTNTRTSTFARVSVTCSKKSTFRVWTGRDASAITGATFQELGYGSFTKTDSPDMVAGAVRATSVVTTNLRPVTAIPVESAITRVVDNPFQGRIQFPLVRGDYLIITCTATTATADVVVELGEQI